MLLLFTFIVLLHFLHVWYRSCRCLIPEVRDSMLLRSTKKINRFWHTWKMQALYMYYQCHLKNASIVYFLKWMLLVWTISQSVFYFMSVHSKIWYFRHVQSVWTIATVVIGFPPPPTCLGAMDIKRNMGGGGGGIKYFLK